MQIARHPLLAWSGLLLVLALTWWAYHPGLHGGFVFDDFANLPALGATGPVTHWATFLRYITSGKADPTGRPLTLLSFLVDGHNWPTAAYPFKRTNVLLHLLNGTLLAVFLTQLSKRIITINSHRAETRVILASITAAGLWLVHPLFVSTVLYVVQREAMLPMTFVLIGLLLWLRGRDALMQGRQVSGITLVLAGLAGCTLLAMLCKANGILLPLYAVLIEYLLLRRPAFAVMTVGEPARANAPDSAISIQTTINVPGNELSGKRAYRRIFLLTAWLPALAVLAYLVYLGIVGAMYGTGRPWTTGQRILTEPRVLFDYLSLLWLPRPFTPGLFNDQFVASLSLWSPPTTALAMAGLAGLLAAGWRLRRNHPALSLT